MKQAIIAALMFLWAPALLAAEWHEARSAHFIVYSKGDPRRLRVFAEELERFDAGMRLLRELPQTEDSPNNRLTVFLLDDAADVQRLGGVGTGNFLGFYKARAGGSVAFAPRRTGFDEDQLSAQTILQHEYAHHFMFRNYTAPFPRWLIEGFAEFSATARAAKDGGIDFGLPAHHRSREVFRENKVTVRDLLANVDLGARPVSGIYGRGWLLTHYLTFAQSRRGQLDRYIAEINKGAPSLEAAERAFGNLFELDREVDRYARARLSYVRIPGTKLKPGPIEIRQMSAGANAILPWHMYSRRGVDEKEAKRIVRRARKAAAPYPDDPFVQVALAEAEIDFGNLDGADAAAARALAADPTTMRAMLVRGRVAVKKLIDAKLNDAKAWTAARRWFVDASRLEPGAPEPLILFHRSFGQQGVQPTENAAAALVLAGNLAPEDRELRLAIARHYLAIEKSELARPLLAVTAFDPHGGKGAELAGAVIAVLDEKGAAAALAAWSALDREASFEGK